MSTVDTTLGLSSDPPDLVNTPDTDNSARTLAGAGGLDLRIGLAKKGPVWLTGSVGAGASRSRTHDVEADELLASAASVVPRAGVGATWRPAPSVSTSLDLWAVPWSKTWSVDRSVQYLGASEVVLRYDTDTTFLGLAHQARLMVHVWMK